jgi:hypothetical protein
MSVRAVLLLGLFLVAAAFAHGGIYSAGQDFVVNRFTGQFQFVPAEEEDEGTTPTRKASVERRLDVGGEAGLTPRDRRRASVSARR